MHSFVVMGVAGSGKSAVGAALAERLKYEFVDADRLHPPANIAKMARSEPLTDADREPWIGALCETIADHVRDHAGLVLACSALRRAHRARMRDAGPAGFVHLYAPEGVLRHRLEQREAAGGHFMNATMLRSQLDTLETPGPDEPDVRTVDATPSLDAVVVSALDAARTLTTQGPR